VREPDAAEVGQRPPLGMDLLEIDFDEFTVGRRAAGPRLDLGAVGKGYALDCMARTLHDWDIEAALLHSGQSTVLALGSPDGEQPWEVALRGPEAGGEAMDAGLGAVYLYDRALSGSSTSERGQHIIDPRTGNAASGKIATWAIADAAARSDALSTAFMVMAPDEVERYCEAHPGVVGLLLVGEMSQPTLLSYGQFARLETS
jgi:thiamine biosynthesis lipoprotein